MNAYDLPWENLRETYSLRGKDKPRVLEAVEAVVKGELLYGNVNTSDDEPNNKPDYKIVSQLCDEKHWTFSSKQWDNFLGAVREVRQFISSLGPIDFEVLKKSCSLEDLLQNFVSSAEALYKAIDQGDETSKSWNWVMDNYPLDMDFQDLVIMLAEWNGSVKDRP